IQHYVSDADHRRQVWRDRAAGEVYAGAPNAGHVALAELERRANLHTLVTQNVDGLHQAAGSSPGRVIEIHGTIHAVKCLECGGMLKSATISFGENLVPEDLMRAQRAAAGADVFLAIGTSLGVYPAA